MKETVQKVKPTILFIHNKYLQKGGEDSVVQNEIYTLQQNGYTIYYKEFNNNSFKKNGLGRVLLPLTIFFNIVTFWKIYFFIKKNKIKIVHVHNFFYKASPSVFWAAKLSGAKTLFTLHNYRLFCLNGIFFRDGAVCFDCHNAGNFKKGISEKCFKSSALFSNILAKSTMFHRKLGTWKNKVDSFVVINPFMIELLTDLGIPSEKIILKPNLLSNYHHKGIKKYEERSDFYLYVGRLSIEKGVEHMVNAFKQCGKKLVIVGEGELTDYVLENISDNIDYRGALTKEEVFYLYESCKALIFPSLWIEGLPMTIIEAQSVGTIPIVAASVNTNRMITSSETGFLYEAGNRNSLLQVIAIFESKNLDELNALSANVQQQFLEHYSEVQHLKAAEQLYQI